MPRTDLALSGLCRSLPKHDWDPEMSCSAWIQWKENPGNACLAGSTGCRVLTQSQNEVAASRILRSNSYIMAWHLSLSMSLLPALFLCFLYLIWLLDKAVPLPSTEQGSEPMPAPSRWASTLHTVFLAHWILQFMASQHHTFSRQMGMVPQLQHRQVVRLGGG